MKIIVSIIIIYLFANISLANAEYCQLTTIQPGMYCSTELKDINWQEKDKKICSDQISNNKNEKCCCIAEKPKEAKKMSPKYIIIGSLLIVFGILTTYFLVTKNSQIS
ncbi:MAG: hypothetical protein NTY12_04120 [Candidatus Falkowbacteria bacterium]|nr:hypothetical protein [Candidatus Falkowbacteria bacterium]